jgi:hypothetical protein
MWKIIKKSVDKIILNINILEKFNKLEKTFCREWIL